MRTLLKKALTKDSTRLGLRPFIRPWKTIYVTKKDFQKLCDMKVKRTDPISPRYRRNISSGEVVIVRQLHAKTRARFVVARLETHPLFPGQFIYRH